MTYQIIVFTSQVQDMTTQVNRYVGPRLPQHANIMASHLRDFITMNPPMFYGSSSDEDPQYFLDEVLTIL